MVEKNAGSDSISQNPCHISLVTVSVCLVQSPGACTVSSVLMLLDDVGDCFGRLGTAFSHGSADGLFLDAGTILGLCSPCNSRSPASSSLPLCLTIDPFSTFAVPLVGGFDVSFKLAVMSTLRCRGDGVI